ncbi:MAG: Gfo/Idh/MocA family oxidoreductase [Planctomycetes bacterium]|nr:Gfo/Idh/MocA family oxidoreductase [Planctomycetota bacterium]
MTRISFLSAAHIHAKGWIEDTVKAGDGRAVHAVWDDNAERGRSHAKIGNAAFVADLDAAVADTKADGFVICAENTRHLPILRKALATGKPVLCEKPLGTTAAEAREIQALVDRHGSRLVNGYVYPFEATYQAVSRLVEARAFGTVTHVRFVNAHGGAWWRWFDDATLAWFHDTALSGGGGMLDEGTHGVHLLRMLFGPVTRVWATARNLSGQYPSADDFGVMHLQFRSGVFGTVEGSWVQTAGRKGLEITGSEGALYKADSGYVAQKRGQQAVPVIPSNGRPHYVDRLVATIRGEIGEDEHRRDLVAALDAVTIMDAAVRSAASGAWVEVGR